MLQIEERYQRVLSKEDRVIVETWSKVLCQMVEGIKARQNRNLYAVVLLDSIYSNHKVAAIFNKPAPQQIHQLPLLNKSEVEASLSKAFIKMLQSGE